MKKNIVKRGFDYEKIYYGAGKEVSENIAKLFPDCVKVVEIGREETSEMVEQPKSVPEREVSGDDDVERAVVPGEVVVEETIVKNKPFKKKRK
jgi:aminopeptidase-like protein